MTTRSTPRCGTTSCGSSSTCWRCPRGSGIAIFLNQTVRGIRIYKSLFFFPFVISQVVVGLMFSWFYAPNFGLFYKLIEWLTGQGVAVLADPNLVTYGIIAAGLWPQIAYCMILYLTGLNNVAPEQIEAARLDGAKGLRMLWHVILPQLRPATFIAVVVTVIGALRSFDLVSIMTDGGPFGSSRVLPSTCTSRRCREYGYRMGYGAAIAVILFLIMMVFISGFIWKMIRDEREGYVMFPRPVATASPGVRAAYQLALPVALILWLFPLIGVAITSLRPASDLASGNYFGMPSRIAFSNYADVFNELADRAVHPELVQGDDPDGDRHGRDLLPHRLRAGHLPVPRQRPDLLPVRRGKFRAVPDPDGAGAQSDGGPRPLQHDDRPRAVPHRVPVGVLHAVHAQLHPGAAVSADRGGAGRGRGASGGSSGSSCCRLMKPAIAALSVLIFTFIWNDYFWATVLTTSAETQPVTAGLYSLNGQWIAAWNLVSAGSIVAAMPPVLMFFLMQKHFIAGLTLGAVK